MRVEGDLLTLELHITLKDSLSVQVQHGGDPLHVLAEDQATAVVADLQSRAGQLFGRRHPFAGEPPVADPLGPSVSRFGRAEGALRLLRTVRVAAIAVQVVSGSRPQVHPRLARTAVPTQPRPVQGHFRTCACGSTPAHWAVADAGGCSP